MNRIFTLCMMLLLQLAAHAQGINNSDYNPENPPGPHEDGYADTWPLVNLTVMPDWVGDTSLSTADDSEVGNHVETGKEVTVNAWTKPIGFSFRAWVAEGDTVSKEAKYTFTMPAKDVNLCAVFDYTPDSPDHPLANKWDKENGEIIMTDFPAGSLNWKMSEVTRRDPWSSDWDLVKNVTVAGVCATTPHDDWEAFNDCKNIEFLDYSRTSGLTKIPAYCFNSYEDWSLKTLVLPATLVSIGIRALEHCTSLTDVTCFATMPPTFDGLLPGEDGYMSDEWYYERWAFEGLDKEKIIVHVPAESVPLYQEARGWKEFMILPITQGVQRLTVNMPQAAQYKDMFLELANSQTGQSLRYVITASTVYTFQNLIRDTHHTLYVKNQRGTVMGIVEGIDIVDKDVTVSLDNMKAPKDVTLRLTTPDGAIVAADDFTATWTDRTGNYLGAGGVLTSQADGAQVVCSIRFGETLGMRYVQPEDTVFTVGQSSTLLIALKTIPMQTIGGTVVAESNGRGLGGATVTVSQILNGRYNTTQTMRTASDGSWTMTVYEAPTTVTVQATDYMPKTDTVDVRLSADQGTTMAITTALSDLTGTFIRLDLYYHPALADGETVDSEDDSYADYQNIDYSVYDETGGRELTDLVLQYPCLVVTEELAEGTRLRVTACSKTGTFNTVETTCRVDSVAKAMATLPIIQRGGLVAVVGTTANNALTGMLFNDKGQLMGSGAYDGKYDAKGRPALPFYTLPDGHYTLVTMGESRCFSNVGTMDALSKAGLQSGIDYVATEASISSGHVDSLFITSVPVFDEERFYSTGPATRFTVNKGSVTAGQYVTLSTLVDFKEGVTPSNVRLVFDLKDGCQMVQNSMMVGTHTAPCSVEGNTVSVAVDDVSQLVRFCVVPTESGVLQPSASVLFTVGGKEVIQPIGTVSVSVSNLTLSVPKTTGRALIPVTGTAIPMSEIKVFDNNVLIGETKALGNGTWRTQCGLNRAYNLSDHNIHAIVTTPEGVQMKSETQTVKFNKGNLTPVVTMTLQSTDYEHKAIVIDFDFRTMKPSQNFYDMRGMGRVHCTYKVNFMDASDLVANDTTASSDVVLYVLMEDRRTINRHVAHYSERYKCWFVDTDYEYWNLPIYVDATWKVITDAAIDREEIDDLVAEAENLFEQDRQSMKDFYEAFDSDEDDEEDSDIADSLAVDSEMLKEIDDILRQQALMADQEEVDEQALLALGERLLALTGKRDDVDNGETERLKQEIEEAVAELDLFMNGLRKDVVDMMALTTRTDTTALERPDGDMSFTIPAGDVDRHYTVQHLQQVNVEQLLSEGYQKVTMTDGTALLMRKDADGFVYIDTKTNTKYCVKAENKVLDGSTAMARGMAAGNKFQLFDAKCVDMFRTTMEKLWKCNEQCKEAIGDYSMFNTYISNAIPLIKELGGHLDCLYKSGVENVIKMVTDSYTKAFSDTRKELEESKKQLEIVQKGITETRTRVEKLNKEVDGLKQQKRMLEKIKNPSADVVRQLRQIDIDLMYKTQDLDLLRPWLKDAEKSMKQLKKDVKSAERFLKKDLPKQFKQASKAFEKIPKTLPEALKIGKPVIVGSGVIAKLVGTVFGAVVQAIPLYLLTVDNLADMEEWNKLEYDVLALKPCEGDAAKWAEIYEDYKKQKMWDQGIDLAHIVGDAVALVLDVVDAPVVTPQWWISTLIDIASVITAVVHPKASSDARDFIRLRLSWLKCKKDPNAKPVKLYKDYEKKRLDEAYENGIYNLDQLAFMYQLLGVVRDPSGFVYEAVSSNRVEGVRASCYYKEQKEDMYGDLYDDVVFWDAENYEQQNPLFTDSDGRYAWDVPQGLWQVKYEKDGYETTYSEWLPVPPPQLEVNVGITQLRQPVVKKVEAYKNAIEVEFDKYMTPSTLTKENIVVIKQGKTVAGTLQLMNAETGYQKPGEKYASRVAFVPEHPLDFNERVVLTVCRAVESYAGMQMESDFQQEFSVVNDTLPIEPGTVEADSTMMVVATPTASRISGTTVTKGTTVALSCSTVGATIWYTTDGSCPCDENGTRMKYTTPIVINEHTVLTVYAVKEPMQESVTVTFEYFIAAGDRTVTMSTAGYATFYSSESAYVLPSGLKAQVVTDVTDKKLTYHTIADGSQGGIVPQGVAVMLCANATKNNTFTLTATDREAEYVGTNMLYGSDVTTMTTAEGGRHLFYKLCFGPTANSKLKNVFGWYWGAPDGGAFQMDGHKAWLAVPKSAGTRGFTVEGDATPIEEAFGASLMDNEKINLYDLQGRRVQKPRKGVYIQNKKKVVKTE